MTVRHGHGDCDWSQRLAAIATRMAAMMTGHHAHSDGGRQDWSLWPRGWRPRRLAAMATRMVLANTDCHSHTDGGRETGHHDHKDGGRPP